MQKNARPGAAAYQRDRPLVNGVISDFEMTEEMLRHLLSRPKAHPIMSYRRALLAIPNNLTEVERKSVEDAALNAGCSKVYLVESPVAAALGAGLPIMQPSASMIVDIGGGTTDIAVISMGGIVVSRTLKIAGDRFNEDIFGSFARSSILRSASRRPSLQRSRSVPRFRWTKEWR